MSVRPEVLDLVRQWVRKAEEDLRTATHTLTLKRDCPVGAVCFHSQQCAEKYLKALLTFHSIPFPKTHDLHPLLTLLSGTAWLAISREDITLINRYSVEPRYPGDWEPVTRGNAEEAVAVARRVRKAARAAFPRSALKSGR